MSATLGQQIVVQNSAGAGGTLARGRGRGGRAGRLHGAACTISACRRRRALYASLPYNPLEDFKTIGLVTEVPMTIVGAQGFRAEHAAGAGRLREGERRHRDLRQCRHRRRLAALRLLFMEAIGTQGDRSALPGHRPGDDRPRRRPGRLHVRPDHQHDRARSRPARSRPTPSPRRSGTRRCRTCRPRRKAGCRTSTSASGTGSTCRRTRRTQVVAEAHRGAEGGAAGPDGRRRASPSSARRRCRTTWRRRRRIASASQSQIELWKTVFEAAGVQPQ